ncbi:MAG: hypothetical protein IH872_00565 [Chloroflexi bacterium]|nr:hypothetical protein [Chloroflexota bacterium]
MITPFRISDALRCMLVDAPGGGNLAAPTESVVRCRPLRNSTFWRQSLARSSNRVTVGDWNGMRLASLASARVRSGVKAWEVDRLHLKELGSGQALDLLEQIVFGAGSRGAERVFLRVPSDSQIVDVARRAGFFPYYEEIHLTGREWLPGTNDVLEENTCRFMAEERSAPDEHGLFQLYCAATPQRVREGIGMTIDQWRDSQEPARPHRNETVLKLDGKIVGWRMREPFGKTTAGQVLGHPSHPEASPYLVRISCQTQNWLVPSYQPNIAELLDRQGLNEAARYTMLIKTVVVPVRNREFSYVEA